MPFNLDKPINLNSFRGRFFLNEKMGIRVGFNFRNNLELGDVQSAYADFLKDFRDYKNFLDLDYYERKIEAIEQQISDYNLYYIH
jgi:hypothetical protein